MWKHEQYTWVTAQIQDFCSDCQSGLVVVCVSQQFDHFMCFCLKLSVFKCVMSSLKQSVEICVFQPLGVVVYEDTACWCFTADMNIHDMWRWWFLQCLRVFSLTLLNRRKWWSVTFPSPEREFPPAFTLKLSSQLTHTHTPLHNADMKTLCFLILTLLHFSAFCEYCYYILFCFDQVGWPLLASDFFITYLFILDYI